MCFATDLERNLKQKQKSNEKFELSHCASSMLLEIFNYVFGVSPKPNQGDENKKGSSREAKGRKTVNSRKEKKKITTRNNNSVIRSLFLSLHMRWLQNDPKTTTGNLKETLCVCKRTGMK
jgi:hypothetical protein